MESQKCYTGRWNVAFVLDLELEFVCNIVEKIRNRRKVVTSTLIPPSWRRGIPRGNPTQEFSMTSEKWSLRSWAAWPWRILDWRMEGRDTKDIVQKSRVRQSLRLFYKEGSGRDQKHGLPSSFVARVGRSRAFLRKVEKALAGEAATIAK